MKPRLTSPCRIESGEGVSPRSTFSSMCSNPFSSRLNLAITRITGPCSAAILGAHRWHRCEHPRQKAEAANQVASWDGADACPASKARTFARLPAGPAGRRPRHGALELTEQALQRGFDFVDQIGLAHQRVPAQVRWDLDAIGRRREQEAHLAVAQLARERKHEAPVELDVEDRAIDRRAFDGALRLREIEGVFDLVTGFREQILEHESQQLLVLDDQDAFHG